MRTAITLNRLRDVGEPRLTSTRDRCIPSSVSTCLGRGAGSRAAAGASHLLFQASIAARSKSASHHPPATTKYELSLAAACCWEDRSAPSHNRSEPWLCAIELPFREGPRSGVWHRVHARSMLTPGMCRLQSPNQWLRVLINQNPSIANHTSAKMPATRTSRRDSGAPETIRRTLSSIPSEPGSISRGPMAPQATQRTRHIELPMIELRVCRDAALHRR